MQSNSIFTSGQIFESHVWMCEWKKEGGACINMCFCRSESVFQQGLPCEFDRACLNHAKMVWIKCKWVTLET